MCRHYGNDMYFLFVKDFRVFMENCSPNKLNPHPTMLSIRKIQRKLDIVKEEGKKNGEQITLTEHLTT